MYFLRKTIKKKILEIFNIKSIKLYSIKNILKDKRLDKKIFLTIYFFRHYYNL